MSGVAAPGPSRVLLFVYGSLKSNCENAHLMTGATLLGVTRTATGYRLIRYHDGYPALVSVAQSASVAGELYSVSAEHLHELDAFEECPTLYRRDAIKLDDGRIVQAYLATADDETRWSALEHY